MARWNDDIDAAPRDTRVIVLAFSYYGPRPIVGEGINKDGIWRWADGKPIHKLQGGECAGPDAWTELPKATARQIAQRERAY